MKAPETLTDSFNRQIDYFRISITDRCNLKCIYCMPEKGLRHFDQSEMLTSDEIIRIVRIACKYGVRKARLTGGEPLLRDDIIRLISGIKDAGVQDLSITTNGQRLASMAGSLPCHFSHVADRRLAKYADPVPDVSAEKTLDRQAFTR
jgi:cyclic pyranopterin phosphate synthase